MKKHLLSLCFFFAALLQSGYADTPSQIVFLERPADFSPKMSVAGCYFEQDGKFLFLLRNENKPQGGSWCIPGGKLQGQETPLEGLEREVFEEIGFQIEKERLFYCRQVYVRFPSIDFVLHLFRYSCGQKRVDISLATEEHTDYQWVERRDVYKLNLIPGGKECFDAVDPEHDCIGAL